MITKNCTVAATSLPVSTECAVDPEATLTYTAAPNDLPRKVLASTSYLRPIAQTDIPQETVLSYTPQLQATYQDLSAAISRLCSILLANKISCP